MTSNLLQEFVATEGRTQGHSFLTQTLVLDLHLILCSPGFVEFALSSLFLIIFICQTAESGQMWVSSFPKPNYSDYQLHKSTEDKQESLDLSFLFKDLGLRNLMNKSQNHQEAPNPWPSILLSCQCHCSHGDEGERWSFQWTICGNLSH